MVLTSITFRAQTHKRGEILSAVDEMVARIRDTAGCGRCRLLVDSEDPNTFLLASEWQSAEDANAFLGSREFHLFRGIRILLRDDPIVVLDDVRSRVTQLVPRC